MRLNRRRILPSKTSYSLPLNHVVSIFRFNGDTKDEIGVSAATEGSSISFANGLYDGLSSGSINFDGSLNGYVDYNDVDQFTFSSTPFSISFTINLDVIGGGSLKIPITKRDGTAGEFEVIITNAGKIQWLNYDGSYTNRILRESNTVLSTSTNYHIVVSSDGTNTSSGLHISINGVNDDGAASSSGTFTEIQNTGLKLRFGRSHIEDNNYSLDGRLDNIVFWDCELNSDEISQLYQIDSNGHNIFEFPDLFTSTLTSNITAGVDTTSSQIYFFQPYLASNFPEVTCDKTYFFLWSTNHDSGDGGIWWGKGNNLDLSDFVEVGLIIDGYQAETPWLMRFEANTRKIHLYYHTDATDPTNNSIQETKLITTTGGELHTTTWVAESNPLGSEVGDQHTGYMKAWDVDGTIIAWHNKQGIDYLGGDGQQQQSVMASDGLSVTRGDILDLYLIMPRPQAITTYSLGQVFKYNNQWYGIVFNRRNNTYSGPGFNYLILCRLDANLNFIEPLQFFGCRGSDVGIFIEGNTLHYYQSGGTTMPYATIDLSVILNYNYYVNWAITDLNVTAFTETTITLDWTTPRTPNAIGYFEVYLDGVFYENTTDASEGWVITGLTAGTSYDITLKTVDTLGNKSAFSNEVTQMAGALILDEVAGFIHAYSHRKLRNAYAGSAIRVRRSSDSTTNDIGFVSDELDETTITTFTGAGNGFKDRFYDQAGSRNLQQTTTSNQPQIVDSGTVVKVSGKPYAQYDATNDFMITSASATPITDDDCTVFVVFESQSAASIECTFNEHTGTVNQFVRINSDTRATGFTHSAYRPNAAGSANLLDFASQQPSSTKRCYVFRKTGTTIQAYDETDTLIASTTITDTFLSDTFLILGRVNNPTPSNYFGGKIAELLINNTALSPTDQTTVLDNIKTYYSIP